MSLSHSLEKCSFVVCLQIGSMSLPTFFFLSRLFWILESLEIPHEFQDHLINFCKENAPQDYICFKSNTMAIMENILWINQLRDCFSSPGGG